LQQSEHLKIQTLKKLVSDHQNFYSVPKPLVLLMKILFKIFYPVLLFVVVPGCKKNIAAISYDTSIASLQNVSLPGANKLGRQKIITLSTGNRTYPTSQALLWTPEDYKTNAKKGMTFPLIFNLYGQGQCGTDLNLLLKDSTMSQFIANGFNATAINPLDSLTYAFIVCSPQCPTSWGWSAPQVKQMLSDLKSNLAIDTDRIYLTGFSCGGWGLWSCMTDDTSLTKQFAAIISISSASADHPDKITYVDKYGIACINICGDQDAFYSNAVSYTNIINSNNPPIPAKLNTLHNVGHSAWRYAYDENWKSMDSINIYQWMLQYKRK